MSDQFDTLWEKIAGKIHGELSAKEETEFNEMIQNTNHLREFEKAKKIREDLSYAGSVSAEGRIQSWDSVEKSIKFDQLRWIKTALKYAAIVVVTFAAGYLFQHKPIGKEIRYSEIFVPYGQMSQVTLSDGTKIWLNSGTTLKYPDQFGENSRTVSISGEAYFKVAKNAENPFFVKSNDLTVKVLGTSFNYSAYKEDATASVTLVEGKVEVQDVNGETMATLHPGQLLTKNKSTNTITTKEVKTAFYSSWSDGKISFDDERFDQIAVKIERWFNVDIAFDNEQLKSQKFTGTILKNKPVDQIMQAFELLSPIRFKHQINTNGKDKITIYSKI